MASVAKVAALVITVMVLTMAMGISKGEEHATAMDNMRGRNSRFVEEIVMGNGGRSMTCTTRPSICNENDVAGSLESRCCEFQCTNVLTDRNNCGRCRNVCSFGFQCCNGLCLNVASDKNHCGSCNVRCKEDQRCAFGMCSYA